MFCRVTSFPKAVNPLAAQHPAAPLDSSPERRIWAERVCRTCRTPLTQEGFVFMSDGERAVEPWRVRGFSERWTHTDRRVAQRDPRPPAPGRSVDDTSSREDSQVTRYCVDRKAAPLRSTGRDPMETLWAMGRYTFQHWRRVSLVCKSKQCFCYLSYRPTVSLSHQRDAVCSSARQGRGVRRGLVFNVLKQDVMTWVVVSEA